MTQNKTIILSEMKSNSVDLESGNTNTLQVATHYYFRQTGKMCYSVKFVFVKLFVNLFLHFNLLVNS